MFGDPFCYNLTVVHGSQYFVAGILATHHESHDCTVECDFSYDSGNPSVFTVKWQHTLCSSVQFHSCSAIRIHSVNRPTEQNLKEKEYTNEYKIGEKKTEGRK